MHAWVTMHCTHLPTLLLLTQCGPSKLITLSGIFAMRHRPAPPPPHLRPRSDGDAARLLRVRRRGTWAAPLLSQVLSATCATKQQHREKSDAAKHLSATNSYGYCSGWGTMVCGQSCNARTQPLLLAVAVVWWPAAQQWRWKGGHFLTSIAVSWSLHKNPNLENNF